MNVTTFKPLNKNKPTVILDADGTLLDFTNGFLSWLSLTYNVDVLFGEPTRFDMSDLIQTPIDTKARITEFNQSGLPFENIMAYPDAIRLIEALNAREVNIIIATACGKSEITRQSRLNTLIREFDHSFCQIAFFDLGEDKKGFLEQHPDAFFVDDLIEHCIDAQAHKQQSFLITRNYNESVILPDNITRLDNLLALLDYVKK